MEVSGAFFERHVHEGVERGAGLLGGERGAIRRALACGAWGFSDVWRGLTGGRTRRPGGARPSLARKDKRNHKRKNNALF